MKAYTRFNTLTWVPTDHFMNERMERYLGIVEKGIGFGSYFVVVLDRDDGCYECLTNTGILVVLTKEVFNGKRTLITAYPPRQDKVFAMFSSCGIDRVPHWMNEKVSGWEWLRREEEKREAEKTRNQQLARKNEFEAHKRGYKRG